MKRSGLITGIAMLQVVLGLVCLALAVYLLVLTRSSDVRSDHDAAEEIYGLRLAAGVFLAPALSYLAAAFGMSKGKLWGWWLAVLVNSGFAALFAYGIFDDGIHNPDFDSLWFSVAFIISLTLLLLRPVRAFFWSAADHPLTAAAGSHNSA